jgi:hypothetical protein
MICACSMRGLASFIGSLLIKRSKMSRTTLFARSPMQWMFYMSKLLSPDDSCENFVSYHLEAVSPELLDKSFKCFRRCAKYARGGRLVRVGLEKSSSPRAKCT